MRRWAVSTPITASRPGRRWNWAIIWKSVGAFEIKEHLIAVGLAVLPAYWYFWQPSSDAGDLRTRKLLTTLLAFIIWWAFLAGHIANNIRGIGT